MQQTRYLLLMHPSYVQKGNGMILWALGMILSVKYTQSEYFFGFTLKLFLFSIYSQRSTIHRLLSLNKFISFEKLSHENLKSRFVITRCYGFINDNILSKNN